MNNFDVLLRMACEQYCDGEVEKFLGRDVSDFQITPHIRRRFKKIKKNPSPQNVKNTKMIRLIVAACLLAISVAITACVAVPKIRDAIKKVILIERGAYVEVVFTDEAQSTEPDANVAATAAANTAANAAANAAEPQTNSEHIDVSEETKPKRPDKILQRAYVTPCPEGCTYELEDTIAVGSCGVWYYKDGDIYFILSQSTIEREHTMVDSENMTFEYVKVNGDEAVLFEEKEDSAIHMLVWQDDQYEYCIYGYLNKDEIISMAESVKLQ